MVETNVVYDGELRCRAIHGPSQSVILTDAPVDNHGKGEAFSPTDLVGASIGTCALTLMGIAARRVGVDMTGATARVVKEMTAIPRRRIGSLTVTIRVPASVAVEHRGALEAAAHTCPVQQSLHPDVRLTVEFVYDL